MRRSFWETASPPNPGRSRPHWLPPMPVESREVFQTEVFHLASALEVLQKHVGMTMNQRLFDMYDFKFSIFCMLCIFNIFCIFPFQLLGEISAHLPAVHDPSAIGPFQGVDYDLLLHCTIGHLRRVDGALPEFADGAKALDFFLGKGMHRYT